MSAIIEPKYKVLSVTKTSMAEHDKENGGYGAYEVVAEVRFTLYSDSPLAEAVKELAAGGLSQLDHALS